MRKSLYITTVVLLLLLSGTNTFADIDEKKLRAAYLYNFIRFASWPKSSFPEHFTICIITENSPGTALKALETRSVNNRKINIRSYSASENLNDCAVVYLPSASAQLQRQLIAQVHDRPVLTISNGAAFVKMGGMIGFENKFTLKKFRQTSRLSFSINLNAAKQAGIKLSSKLLNIAAKVKH